MGWALASLCACAPTKVGEFPSIVPEVYRANRDAGDPHRGRFTYEAATEGLAPGRPHARLQTSAGTIECALLFERAPLTVANFIGLARGLRPFRDSASGQWVTEPYYTELPWHRAEARQFVQTGRRPGAETAGFVLQDERSLGDAFDGPGVLAMANAGREHSASAQFFVTTSPLRAFDGEYTIFGRCSDQLVVRELERQVLAGKPASLHVVEIYVPEAKGRR